MSKNSLIFVRKLVNSQLFSSFPAAIKPFLSNFHFNSGSRKGLLKIEGVYTKAYQLIMIAAAAVMLNNIALLP
ncbi:MAG: hypothetical protein ACI9SP_000329 [Arenicella sp.]|jgi:hypothetical protein